jgi:hypothetical protein
LAFKDFSAGDILTAADVDTYLMRQTVMVFADSTARASALGTAIVTEGMVAYTANDNLLQYYTGTVWSNLVDTSTFLTASSTATLTNKSIDGNQLVTVVNTVAATATTYTASAADRNELIYSLATAAMTITVPDVFNIGDRIDVIRDGAGTVSIAAGTGATSWAGAGTAGTAVVFKIDQQYNGATIQKVATNTYRVIGKITV